MKESSKHRCIGARLERVALDPSHTLRLCEHLELLVNTEKFSSGVVAMKSAPGSSGARLVPTLLWEPIIPIWKTVTLLQ